jgi:hypothetical protein
MRPAFTSDSAASADVAHMGEAFEVIRCWVTRRDSALCVPETATTSPKSSSSEATNPCVGNLNVALMARSSAVSVVSHLQGDGLRSNWGSFRSLTTHVCSYLSCCLPCRGCDPSVYGFFCLYWSCFYNRAEAMGGFFMSPS